MYLFCHGLPTADLWQDEPWRARLEALQGFSAAAERRAPRAPRSPALDAAMALAWLLAKHEAELRMMKGQVQPGGIT